ncbi:MAG: hypothetical protein OEO79_13735 [Gemmatimonadota bacterium]|nr:hypothetical protein [Gemmatimonadota bacterium]MDH3423780.1 hypothetical protein [Gemmatimonadota bacterium]
MSVLNSTLARRVGLWFLWPIAALVLWAEGAGAQVLADPILAGRVMLADSTLTSGTVVLHQLSQVTQGEIDSVAVAPDGSFVLRLPRIPDPALGEMYFASIRHDGVMYFGDAITVPIDLDSLYLIQAFDTLIAPLEGVPVALEARSLFFEPSGSEWAVTDVFQLRNDRDRTVVPRQDGRVWSYPLPAGARDLTADNEMSADVVAYVDGSVVFRAALPPGERLFVVRYFVDSLALTIPTPGGAEMLDVLIREPAPAIAVEGLVQEQGIQLEAGTTYRRFAGENVTVPQLRLTMVEEAEPPPVEWIAVVLTLVLAGGGLMALRGGARSGTAAREAKGAGGRQSLLVELARLDEQYEGEPAPTAARTRQYKTHRAELIERLRSLG